MNTTQTRHAGLISTLLQTPIPAMIMKGIIMGSIVSLTVNVVSAAELYDLKPSSPNTAKPLDIEPDRINLRYREDTGVTQRLYTKDEILGVKSFSSNDELLTENNIEQYDATLYYAIGYSEQDLLSKQQWYSIDLGVNFKFIEKTYETTTTQQIGLRTYYGAYPMFSASALFDLPLSGMTATVKGSYYSHNTQELSEYRAIVSYKIDNTFGVSGGWEQQQYQLDATDNLRFDKTGPFVDMFYRF